MNDKLKLILALALNLILKCAQTLRKGLAFEHSLLKPSLLIFFNVPSVETYPLLKDREFFSSRLFLVEISH